MNATDIWLGIFMLLVVGLIFWASRYRDCPICHGTGMYPKTDVPCYRCNGSGKV